MTATRFFARTELLLGAEAMARLAAARVAIVGLGGVGSCVAEALVRSGVGAFTLIDGDGVDASNVNRQMEATALTLGQPKVVAMRERMLTVNPAATIDARAEYFAAGRLGLLTEPRCDFVVDAIDDIEAKVALIVAAQRNGLPVVSSMGAGNKLDPTAFRVGDIYATSVCPLAKVMRRRLRERGVKRLTVVYSTEPPRAVPPGAASVGSVAFVTAVAGMALAAKVVEGLTS